MAKLIDEIKAEQGFSMVGPTCDNCKHFSTKMVTKTGLHGNEYQVESYLRCGIGGFKVGKTNWCQKHEWIQ